MTEFVIRSPVGPLRLLEEKEKLVGLYFGGIPTDGVPPTALLRETEAQLRAYFRRELRRFDLPIRYGGTEFQHRIWQALETIPYGTTATYGQMAAAAGRPKGAHATGQAVGKNPISIIVPCHRVVGKNGALTGFGGGLQIKRKLLAVEGLIY